MKLDYFTEWSEIYLEVKQNKLQLCVFIKKVKFISKQNKTNLKNVLLQKKCLSIPGLPFLMALLEELPALETLNFLKFFCVVIWLPDSKIQVSLHQTQTLRLGNSFIHCCRSVSGGSVINWPFVRIRKFWITDPDPAALDPYYKYLSNIQSNERKKFKYSFIFLDLLRTGTWYLVDDIFFFTGHKTIQIRCGSGSVIIWPSGSWCISSRNYGSGYERNIYGCTFCTVAQYRWSSVWFDIFSWAAECGWCSTSPLLPFTSLLTRATNRPRPRPPRPQERRRWVEQLDPHRAYLVYVGWYSFLSHVCLHNKIL